jgi:hypothetical protein
VPDAGAIDWYNFPVVSDVRGVCPAIERGRCILLFAYDVGVQIDLPAAERRIQGLMQRDTIKRTHRAPGYFEYSPAPLRITASADPVPLGPWSTNSSVDLVLYDFGAVSVHYSIPLSGPFSDLLELAERLYDNAALLDGSRHHLERTVDLLRGAIVRPAIADAVEDYAIFSIESFQQQVDPGAFCESCAEVIAQVLRAESGPLSRDEVVDATTCRLSYSATDLTIVDWNAALVIDPKGEDVRSVLEFANVELLEMRHLDRTLDRAPSRS